MEKIVITDIDRTILDNQRRKHQCLIESLGRVVPSEQSKQYAIMLEGEERKKFFSLFLSDKYVSLDQPIHGAVDTLNWVVSNGTTLVYATGRPDIMKEATVTWLRSNGFPIPGDKKAYLFLREGNDQGKDDKERVLSQMLPKIQELGFPVCGIGDLVADAVGYLKAGFPALILKDKHDKEQSFPPGTTTMNDWAEIRSWLENNC